MMIDEAKEKLLEGNRRFVSGTLAQKELGSSRLIDLAENGQHPFAVIVCCSDSRVPPEILLDQGLGDIFVIRTAGNVIDEVALGSIEYAVLHLHVSLVVVLGHENCGAVKAAVDDGGSEGSIQAVIDKIIPALKSCRDSNDIYKDCEDQNIFNMAEIIKNDSTLHPLIHENKLEVVGAKYSITSGLIHFFAS